MSDTERRTWTGVLFVAGSLLTIAAILSATVRRHPSPHRVSPSPVHGKGKK